MAQEKGYQGWKNYETWALKLWLDNDEGSQNWQRELAEQYKDEEYPIARIADHIKETIEDGDLLSEKEANIYTDLLGAAISDINYDEIARHILNEYKENLEYDIKKMPKGDSETKEKLKIIAEMNRKLK